MPRRGCPALAHQLELILFDTTYDPAMLVHRIRTAQVNDAPELARLLTELGHPTTTDSIAARWSAWISEDDTVLVAAEPDGKILGVATLHRMAVLHRPRPVGRITALIVDTAARGRGVGRALVAAAESWSVSGGCGLLEITSNFRLSEAHAFYEHLGYDKTSFRLAKNLLP